MRMTFVSSSSIMTDGLPSLLLLDNLSVHLLHLILLLFAARYDAVSCYDPPNDCWLAPLTTLGSLYHLLGP